jgi:hypothetical protein
MQHTSDISRCMSLRELSRIFSSLLSQIITHTHTKQTVSLGEFVDTMEEWGFNTEWLLNTSQRCELVRNIKTTVYEKKKTLFEVY